MLNGLTQMRGNDQDRLSYEKSVQRSWGDGLSQGTLDGESFITLALSNLTLSDANQTKPNETKKNP